jgi:hypothetical protein
MRDYYFRPGSKTPEIIRLWKQNLTKTEIAQITGCTKANVTQTIRRHLAWDNRVEMLTEEHHNWLIRQAAKSFTSPAVMARAMLTDAIDEAMQKEDA